MVPIGRTPALGVEGWVCAEPAGGMEKPRPLASSTANMFILLNAVSMFSILGSLLHRSHVHGYNPKSLIEPLPQLMTLETYVRFQTFHSILAIQLPRPVWVRNS